MTARAQVPPDVDEPGRCPHLEFDALTVVNRFEDTGRFSVDVRIACHACGMPFRFLGLPAGSDPEAPRVSVDALELRAPIEPEDTPQLHTRATFVMPPRPPRPREGN